MSFIDHSFRDEPVSMSIPGEVSVSRAGSVSCRRLTRQANRRARRGESCSRCGSRVAVASGCRLEVFDLALEAPDRLHACPVPGRALRPGLFHQRELAYLLAQMGDLVATAVGREHVGVLRVYHPVKSSSSTNVSSSRCRRTIAAASPGLVPLYFVAPGW